MEANMEKASGGKRTKFAQNFLFCASGLGGVLDSGTIQEFADVV